MEPEEPEPVAGAAEAEALAEDSGRTGLACGVTSTLASAVSRGRGDTTEVVGSALAEGLTSTGPRLGTWEGLALAEGTVGWVATDSDGRALGLTDTEGMAVADASVLGVTLGWSSAGVVAEGLGSALGLDSAGAETVGTGRTVGKGWAPVRVLGWEPGKE